MKLEKFIITKLNGYQNVEIDIDNNKKILVAENGSGKTTILNILFYCLKNNTSKLKNFNFEKVELI
ncbi:MAG: AAA family ATPase, partial [Acinetobacter sp.]